MSHQSVLRSSALILLGAAGCITPPSSAPPPAPPTPATASPEKPTSSPDDPLDPARVYALHLERAAELEEECERGAVDLEAFTDTAAYLLQFQAHPIRDAALRGLEPCRQLVLDTFDEVRVQTRPSRMKAVAESLEAMMRESLEVLELEGEISVEHEGLSLTLTLDVPNDPESVVEPDAFESLCEFVQLYGVETLVLIDNGERSECTQTSDESAIMESVFEEINLSPPLDPPPAGDRPVPID